MTRNALPSGLRAAGKRLWSSVVDEYELDEHEQAQLLHICRMEDLLDQLEAAVRRDGPLINSPQGMKAHPAIVEGRQQALAQARLIAALRLPVGSEGEQAANARQKRMGVRGVQRMAGA